MCKLALFSFFLFFFVDESASSNHPAPTTPLLDTCSDSIVSVFMRRPTGRMGSLRSERAFVLAAYVFATLAVTALFSGVGTASLSHINYLFLMTSTPPFYGTSLQQFFNFFLCVGASFTFDFERTENEFAALWAVCHIVPTDGPQSAPFPVDI